MFALNLLTLAAAAIALPTALAGPLTRRTPAPVYTQCTQPGVIALTYDDGPYQWTEDIVNTLDAHGVKATFFFNGNNFECIYSPANVARLQKVYKSGHQVASHGWAHADLAKIGADAVGADLDKINAAIQEITGAFPKFMRPPFGSYNDEALEVIGSRKQEVAMWNFDVHDADGTPSSQMIDSYTKLASSGLPSIVALNHETYEASAKEVLVHAITTLKGAGYKFVTFAECVGSEPYLSVGTPKTTGGTC